MPKKYDYKGNAVTGSATDQVSPYSVVGMSGTYDVNKYASVTVGIDNLFDKRHFRQGNAQTTGNATTGRGSMAQGPIPLTSRAAPGI